MVDTSWQRRNFSFLKIMLAFSLSLALAACGQDEEQAERIALYQSYTLADLQAMVDGGDQSKALEALQYYRNEGIATNEQMFLLAQLYVKLGGGIAAEETISKLRARGFSEERSALPVAQSLILQGKRYEAEQVLLDVELPEEDVFNALVLRGDLAYSAGDVEQAEYHYLSAIEAAPDNHLGYTAAALFYIQTRDFQEADRLAEKAIVLDANDYLVHYAQGMVARYTNRIDEAREHFLRSIELNEDNILSRIELTAIFLAQNSIDAAKEQLDEIYAKQPNNPMANYFTSLLLVRDGKFEEAEALLVLTGDFTQAYPLAAQIYGLTKYELKKYSTAITFLTRALRSFPNDVPVRLALADSMVQKGQARRALGLLEPLVEAGNVTAMVHAAAAASGIGDLRAARRYIDQALQLAENNENFDAERINDIKERAAFARLFDSDFEGAISLFDGGRELDADTLLIKANMLLSNNQLSQAAAVLDQLLQIDPESNVANNLKGAILHRQGRYDEAIEAYSAAINILPTYQSALKNRASSYLAKRDYVNARTDLRALLDASATDPEILAMYGRALGATDDAEAAVEFFERATDAMPNSPVTHADFAEVLAALKFYSRAISAARKAKRVGTRPDGLEAYLDQRIADWEILKAELQAQQLEERDSRLEKALKQQAEENKRQNAILEQSADIIAESKEDKALTELRRVARESLKLSAAVEAKAKAEAQALRKSIQDELANYEESETPDMIRITRNQLFGLWLSIEVGLVGEPAIDYVQSIVLEDESEAGDTDLIRRALRDLEAAGKTATIQSIEAILAQKMVEAVEKHTEREEKATN